MLATVPRRVLRRHPVGLNLLRQMESSFALARAPRLRSMRRFAEEEITIPDGRYKGRRFRVDRQPVAGLYLDAVDSGLWTRFNGTGPSQSGKTLCCFLIVLLFHLFEIRETVVLGLPDMDMAKDKWACDILPVMECTRYREFLPKSGAGSQGGTPRAITMSNGATLRFMSAGGGDKSRAGFTTRVLIVTETDGFDEASPSSREGDKVSQLEARQASWPKAHRRTYFECTPTTPEGRTWRELTAGTNSRIAMPCPACGGWSVATNTAADRGALIGWQGTESLKDAEEQARWCCQSCGAPWTDAVRAASMQRATLVHRGQEIGPDGEILGPLPDTDTLGFRWGAVHNLFLPAATIAAAEWKAEKTKDESPDPEDVERVLCQFVHGLAYVGPDDLTRLDPSKIKRRTASSPRGLVPAGTDFLTLGVDCGKFLVHYTLVAWISEPIPRSQIVDYGTLEVHSDDQPVEFALSSTLRQLRDLAGTGWAERDAKEPRVPDLALVDSGWYTDTVYAFCRESDGFEACKGYGTGRQGGIGRSVNSFYEPPKRRSSVVREIGNKYHVARMKGQGILLVELDSNWWKAFVQDSLRVPAGTASGAMTLFDAPAKEHERIAHHVCAERQVTSFVPGKGQAVTMERVGRKANHFLDCLAYASVAGHACLSRFTAEADEGTPEASKPALRNLFRTPDDRPFVIV